MLRKIIKKIYSLINQKNTNSDFQRISYSQSGEDLIIKFIFDNILCIEKPSYIDIGANHPFDLSNTALFYINGSRGINIEPNPELIALFNFARKDDVNLNIGISDKTEYLTFFFHRNPKLSTFDPNVSNLYKDDIIMKKNIATDTINNIVNQYFNGVFPDFLNVDVEGLDYSIIKSINYQQSAPKVICVETIMNISENLWTKNKDIIAFLQEQGYYHHSDTSINSIFVLKKLMKHQII